MMGKVAVAGISLILVVGVIIGVIATVSRGGDSSSSDHKNGGLATGMKAVEALCGPADFKDLCTKTLSPIAQKNSNATPKDLMQATMEATMEEVNKAVQKSAELAKGITNSTYDKMSIDDCKEVMDYAIYELKKVIKKVSNSEMHTLGQVEGDLKTWLSAVLAYRSTCLDDIVNPELKKSMEDGGLTSTNEHTNNAISIIDEVSKILSKINITVPDVKQISQQLNHTSRRLLDSDVEVDKDNYPTWFSAADRKLLAGRNAQLVPNVVVAQDGSGQFKSINQAIAAYPKNHRGRFVIYVKAGIYREYVVVPQTAVNVYMYGDGPRRTVVTGNRNVKLAGYTTKACSTFTVFGDGFVAKSMGFRNTAGPAGHQAVALLVSSDFSAFYNCRIDANQDSLYYNSKRQYYRNCVISGTIDFIFGMGTALIQNSKIIARLGDMGQFNALTADGRETPKVNTGVVIQNCHIVPEAILVPKKFVKKSYLGRPWKPYARTMIMESVIGDFIRPEGWSSWDNNHVHESTCEYREYGNRGLGANTNGRIKWRGYQVVTDRRVAQQYTAVPLLDGGRWIPATGGQVTLGLRR
ncbi:Pectinesterase/pectinesterase inhibitor [Thalictrum thalictroides]|uniref:Pectinesterase n=1 Tax=Thalictrum thalictroides TaxID=46969 RepID=A0A7J6X8N5_THATH|nr:Pectinesterase/pectinesterase inhibitor [Thalictrum thalictroides]